MHNAYALVRVENWFSNHCSNQLAISWKVNSLRFLSSLPDASGKSLLRKLGFGYMLSPMVAYTSRIIMQAIPARVIHRTLIIPFSALALASCMTSYFNPSLLCLIPFFPCILDSQPCLSWSLTFTRFSPHRCIKPELSRRWGRSSSDYSAFYIHVCWLVGWRWGSIFIVRFRCGRCLAWIIVANQYILWLVPRLRNAPISSKSLSLESWSLGVLRVVGPRTQCWIFRKPFFARAYLRSILSHSVWCTSPLSPSV